MNAIPTAPFAPRLPESARKDILSKLSVADRIELETSFEANRAAIDAANDEHANRVLARVKAHAAKLMADLPNRIDEEPNRGPLWDDHDIASIRAASWDGSL